MIEASAFKDAEAYIRDQQRLISQTPADQLASLVIPSIDRLVVEHIDPITHAIYPNVPPMEDPWLDLALGITATNNDIVNPRLEGRLPARYSKGLPDSRFHGLFVPMDGSVLKIQTVVDGPKAIRTAMQVVEYSLADEKEIAAYNAAIARSGILGALVATSLLRPRKKVEYNRGYSRHDRRRLACVYNNYNNPDEDRGVMGRYQERYEVQPGYLAELHQQFMRSSRIAIVGLRSALR